MAGKTASLSINVIADAAKAKAGFSDLEKALNNVKKSVSNAEGTFGKFKAGSSAAFDAVKKNAAVFAAAAGASIAAFGIKSVNAFQNLALSAGKFSDATGIAVEDASRLIEVAGDIGVELGSVEKSLGFMNKTLGKSPDLFRELGVQIKYSKDGTTDINQTFLEVVDRLNAIKDPAERAAVASKLLGKGWADMAELIATGSDQLSQSLASVSDAKIIDPDEVAKAREFRDTMDNLKDNFEDLALTLGETLVPILGGTIKTLNLMPDSVKKVATNLTLAFIATEALETGFEKLGVATKTTSTIVGGFRSVLFGLTLATGILDFLNEIGDASGNSDRKLQRLAIAIDTVKNGSMRSIDPLKEFRDLVAAEGKKGNLANIVKDLGKEITIVGGSIGRDIEYIDQAFNKLAGSSPKAAQSLLNIWTSQTNALDTSSQQYKDNIMLIKRYQERLNLLNESSKAFKNLNDEASKIVPVLKENENRATKLRDRWKDANDTFSDGRFVSQALVDVWRNGSKYLVEGGRASQDFNDIWVNGYRVIVDGARVSEDLVSAWKLGYYWMESGREVSDSLINAWREGYRELRNADSVSQELVDTWKDGYRAMIEGREASDELKNSVKTLGAQANNAKTLVNGLTKEWEFFLGLLDKKDAFESAQQSIDDYTETFKKAAAGNKEAQEEVNEKLRQGQREIARARELADLIPLNQDKKIQFLTETGQLQKALDLLKLVDSWYMSVQRRQQITSSGMGSGRTPEGGVYVDGVYIPPGIDFSKLSGLASGGTLTSSGSVVVGESGPELLNLPAGASVTPNIPQLLNGGGGQTVVVNVSAGLVSSPDQVGAQIIDAIRRAERRSGQVFASA